MQINQENMTVTTIEKKKTTKILHMHCHKKSSVSIFIFYFLRMFFFYIKNK